MPTLYNRIQGRNLERLAALSDGIFAIAMTLLVLDLHIPAAEAVHSEGALLAALCAHAPQYVAYGMSFLTSASSGPASKPSSTILKKARATLPGFTWAFSSPSPCCPSPPACLRSSSPTAPLSAHTGSTFLRPASCSSGAGPMPRATAASNPTPLMKSAAAFAAASQSRSRSTPWAPRSASSAHGSALPLSCWCS